MQATPYAEVNRVLESLLSQLRDIFQGKLVGLYLDGSLTAGDFDPEISDIDLLAVTSSEISEAEFEALRSMHEDIARDNPAWDDRIEVVYVSERALRNFRAEQSPIVISPGEPFHVKDGEPLKDWLQNWYVIRESGVVLFGPPPTVVIPQITQNEYAQAIRDYAAYISERAKNVRDRKEQAYSILTMCRALHVHREGAQSSKLQAALWAQQQLPEWSGLIESALAWRQAWRDEQVDHAATHSETVRFVNYVRELILAPRANSAS